MKTYKIKPLEWKKNEFGHDADFLHGNFRITREYYEHVDGSIGKYSASYCFVEYFDEGFGTGFKTILEAKIWCQDEALKRILKELEEV